jgi:hypothetical protein
MEEVEGVWRRLPCEELHNLHASPNIIRVINSKRIGGACSTHGSDTKFIQNFDRKT